MEPLISLDDLSEYRDGLNNFAAGRWSDDRWKTFRLLFGIYGQRQDGFYMIRSKIPAGKLSFAQARTAAAVNARYGGSDIHITTRQDLQFYSVALHSTPSFLEALYVGGVATREASGNTFRNVVACPLAGFCPHELLDAAELADALSTTWLRHPLVQHMPRKFKTTVSGCGFDCGDSAIDDLGFIATVRKGRRGFRVVAGGGLGNRPRRAVVVAEFIETADLAAVQEAFARMHHVHSNRENRNASRIKFLVDRYGEQGFVALFWKFFNDIIRLEQRRTVAARWRTPSAEGPPPSVDDGVIAQHDGRYAVVVRVPLGMLDSGRLRALSDLAEEMGAAEFRLTRDQNIIAVGLPERNRSPFMDRVEELGLNAGGRADALSGLVSCPGTSTCAIGITDAAALAKEITEDRKDFAGFPDVSIRISGCHNSCGQHHMGDFGLHAMAKKINGESAPHYRFHVGGDADVIGLAGPIVPARLASAALKKLIGQFAATRLEGESVRDWALRIGDDGLDRNVEDYSTGDRTLLLDVGSDKRFVPPTTTAGECAAPAVAGEYLADLAANAHSDISRRLEASARADAGRDAVAFAIRRLLLIVGADHEDHDFAGLRSMFLERFSGEAHAARALDRAVREIDGGDGESMIRAVGQWLAAADDLCEALISTGRPLAVPA